MGQGVDCPLQLLPGFSSSRIQCMFPVLSFPWWDSFLLFEYSIRYSGRSSGDAGLKQFGGCGYSPWFQSSTFCSQQGEAQMATHIPIHPLPINNAWKAEFLCKTSGSTPQQWGGSSGFLSLFLLLTPHSPVSFQCPGNTVGVPRAQGIWKELRRR